MRFYELLEDLSDISGELNEELRTLEGVSGFDMVDVMKSLVYLATNKPDDPETEEIFSQIGMIMPKAVYRDLKKYKVNIRVPARK
jgi:hypothetical protein